MGESLRLEFLVECPISPTGRVVCWQAEPCGYSRSVDRCVAPFMCAIYDAPVCCCVACFVPPVAALLLSLSVCDGRTARSGVNDRVSRSEFPEGYTIEYGWFVG